MRLVLPAVIATLVAFGLNALPAATSKAGLPSGHTAPTPAAKPPATVITTTTTTVGSTKPATAKATPPAKSGQPAPPKPASPGKPANPKLVVQARPVLTQGTRWVVTYRESLSAAEHRMTFPALDPATRWLDAYKAKHPQALGSVTSEASGAMRSGK